MNFKTLSATLLTTLALSAGGAHGRDMYAEEVDKYRKLLQAR